MIFNFYIMKLNIHITPNSKKSEVSGEEIDLFGSKVLRVKVAAPPKEGKANKELIKILSERYDIPKSKVFIIAGEKSRNKVVEII